MNPMKNNFLFLIFLLSMASCTDAGKGFNSCSSGEITCVSATADRLNMLEPYTIELQFSSKDSRYKEETAAIELQLASELSEAMSIEWQNDSTALIEFQLKNGSVARYKLDHLKDKFHFRVDQSASR